MPGERCHHQRQCESRRAVPPPSRWRHPWKKEQPVTYREEYAGTDNHGDLRGRGTEPEFHPQKTDCQVQGEHWSEEDVGAFFPQRALRTARAAETRDRTKCPAEFPKSGWNTLSSGSFVNAAFSIKPLTPSPMSLRRRRSVYNPFMWIVPCFALYTYFIL